MGLAYTILGKLLKAFHSPLFPGKSDIKDVVYHADFVVYHELPQRFFGFHIGATDTVRRIMTFRYSTHVTALIGNK